jgi:ribosomal subunit interface protein
MSDSEKINLVIFKDKTMKMESSENVKLFFKGLKIDERTEEYVRKRLRATDKLNEKIMRIEVEIDKDKKGKFRAEVMVITPYKNYRAEETSESIEGSIDTVEEELCAQMTKDKDRRKTMIKRGGMSIKKKMVIDEKARF